VVPNEDGTIDFEFFIATPQSRFVYINALKIEEVDVPEELAVAKKFYIDFGKNNETQGNPVTSPDANGNYWNNVYSNGNDATRGASDGTDNLTLVTSDNKTTLYELELANNNVEFNGNGGLTNPDAALLGDLAIADATRDYVFTNNDGDIVLNFKKLNTAKTYRFNVFGSRNEADGRMGIITLTGENTFTGAHQTTGKHIGGTGINGNNRVIFVSDTITPTAEGLITLSMKQKFGMAYINAIKVEEITNTFIVTFNSNGGTAVASQEVFKNTAATEPDAPEPATPELEGHVLAGWYTDEALTIAYDFDTPLTADITLYAKWEIAVYTITYHTNGSDNIADATYTIESEDLTLPVPTRTGYTFRGWFDNSEFTGEAVTGIPAGSTGDKAFYAKWEANVYAIVYHLNDGVGAEDATYTIESATITLPVPTKEGYDFSGWYANERFAGAVFTEIPQGSTGKKEFWAKWEEEANGIDELNVNLQLYPNPVVNGKLTINNILSNNGKVELYNVLGSLAGIYEITGNTTVIDISALPAGTYFVKINGQIAKILKK
jgi:uncharacterized repeat protein (TIGR02543 family)